MLGELAFDAHRAQLVGSAAAGPDGARHEVRPLISGRVDYHLRPDRLEPRMIRSMTAFAASERAVTGGLLSCELRAVNHRYLELSLRMPEELRAIESALRERVAAKVSRGKIDMGIRYRPSVAAVGELRVNER